MNNEEAAERPRKRRPAPIDTEDTSERVTSGQPTGGAEGYVSKYAQYWEDDDPPPPKKPDAPVMASEGGREFRYGQGVQVTEYDTGDLSALPNDPLALAKNVWKSFLALPLFQRIYAGGSVALFFFSMIPWCTFIGVSGYPESDYVSANFLAMLLAVACVFALVLQKTEILPKFPRKNLPLIPLATGALSALVILLTTIYLIASSIYRPAMFGLGAAFLASCVIFVGSGASLMKKE